MKTFIIYHKADLDGLFGGALIDINIEGEKVYVPYNYGDDIDLESMKNHSVYMVDCSLPRKDMERLNNNTNFIWLDHHISAIKDMEGLEIAGTRDTKKAGCQLALEHFGDADDSILACIQLLSEYDTWNHNGNYDWDNEVLPFQYGMRLEVGLDFEEAKNMINRIFVGDILLGGIIKKGKTIIKNNKQQREQWMRKSGEVEIEGLKGLALFGPAGGSSQIFESKRDNIIYDLMVYITYNITKKEYSVSLYTDKEGIDCSVIAKSFGGGGHKGASGFICKELPFNI